MDSNRKKKVVILGGGVAGMSAAHELVERGFEVTIYDRNEEYVGGKARSVNVPETNLIEPDKYLPGEHGFRFFPGFYKHVTDTMSRIPYKNADGTYNHNGVLDNLTPTTLVMIARYGKEPIVSIASFPKTSKAWKTIIHDVFGGIETGLTKEEEEFFAKKVWQLMTSSTERRQNDYEKLGWWEYCEADRFGDVYRHLLVEGLTRTLVAAQAKSASTKTGGDIFLQLIFNMLDPSINTDRVLNGPTNERWLNPWKEYLESKGVKFFLGHEATKIEMKDGKVSSVTINKINETITDTADYYLLAVPVERAAELINDEIVKVDETLASINTLAKSVSWMNGIQFYLNEDVKINDGHVIYCDSEWAITSISQVQFWKDYDLSKRYNGKVKGVLSVDISDWLYNRYNGKLAEECEPKDVATLVWEQIKTSLNVNGKTILRDDMIVRWYLDRDIKWQPALKQESNREPLLVNTINSWELRPESYTGISNLFLAADYVKTNTDLATMEGANEAARRAVNGIITASGISAPMCKIWELEEPSLFLPLKWLDKKRFEKGLPYSIHLPFWMKIIMVIWGGLYLILTLFKWIKSKFN